MGKSDGNKEKSLREMLIVNAINGALLCNFLLSRLGLCIVIILFRLSELQNRKIQGTDNVNSLFFYVTGLHFKTSASLFTRRIITGLTSI